MIIDSSAIIAVFFKEPGYEEILIKLCESAFSGISCPTLVETGIVISARLGFNANPQLSRFLQEFGITEIPFGEGHWREAINAYNRYGKGKNPAALNFGDCMTYAVSRLSGSPLLFTNDDFSKTDISPA